MRISICIPHYNRIDYLIRNLEIIRQQDYGDLEVVISDDASTDDSAARLEAYVQSYPFPVKYHRNRTNLGYDRNLRQSLELASGDYLFILGNDDSLVSSTDISFLASFLSEQGLPEVGFCNYIEDGKPGRIFERAFSNSVLGTGADLSLAHTGNFSFVAGLVFKREAFLRFNTDRCDGSIYVQVYLACCMVASGSRLFGIKRPLVLKDIQVSGNERGSFKDKIARKWKDVRPVDGGLPSVINVLITALSDANVLTHQRIYRIFFKIYSITFPHWLLEYRALGAMPESVGLIMGLHPHRNINFSRLHFLSRMKIRMLYVLASLAGILSPVVMYQRVKPALFSWVRKRGFR